MKVFLDDERPTPSGWVHARWPEDVIDMISTGHVDEISLDHDLGDDEHGTGYTVLLWIEEQVALFGLTPPIIHIHSANSSARKKMELCVSSINRIYNDSNSDYKL